MKCIKNVSTYDFNKFEANRYIIFNEKIIETGFMEDFEKAVSKYSLSEKQITHGRGGLLIPGLILGHTHIYSTFARGMILPFNPKNFLQILEQQWWKMDAALDREKTYYSGMISSLGYIKNGVTTIIDHHASGKEIIGTLEQLKRSVVDDMGLRGMFCFETSDRFNVDECIKENLDFKSRCSDGVCASHFGMHAAMTLSDETLTKIKDVIGDQPIHIHVAESVMDQEDSRENYAMTVIERLDKFGLLNKNSLIVHGIYLTDREMEIIAERECYVALNPLSNMNNGVGLPDYPRMKKHGIKCIIGNDGLGSGVANEWQALLFSSHYQKLDPLAADLGDIHSLITNSYDYANTMLKTKLGRLEKDYCSDFILLDELNPTPLDDTNALGHLFFGMANSLRPSHVWCRGELKLENYRYLKDYSDIYDKSRELSAELWTELKED